MGRGDARRERLFRRRRGCRRDLSAAGRGTARAHAACLPGYGAQGAKGTDIAGCFDANGNGAIVNASRSILCAWKKREGMAFDAAARDEALRMKQDLCDSLAAVGKAIK